MADKHMHKPGKLSEELLALQRRSQRVDLAPSLVSYLRRLSVRTSNVDVISTDTSRERVALDDVYIKVPIGPWLSINVRAGRVDEIWLDNAGESDSNNRVPQTANEFADTQYLAQLKQVVQSVVDKGADAEHSDPASRPLIASPPWYDGTRRRFWPLYCEDAIGLWPRVVLLGAPGSGKSTFLRYVAQRMATSMLAGGKQSAVAGLGLPPAVPIYIELRKFFNSNGGIPIHGRVGEQELWDFIEDQLKPGATDLSQQLRELMSEGRGILLLDGIDEIPVPEGADSLRRRRAQMAALSKELTVLYPDCHIVLTGRDYALSGWDLPGFHKAHISPLRRADVKSLVSNLARERGLSGETLHKEVDSLVRALDNVSVALRDYPLFVSLMAALYWTQHRNSLPASRSQLYRESVDLLLERWTASESDGEPTLLDQLGCSKEQLEQRLRRIAYQTHRRSVDRPGSAADIEFAVLVTELFRLGPGVDPHKVLAYLAEYAGILVAQEPEKFNFAHRGFQEYLTAAWIKERLDADEEGVEAIALELQRDIIETPLAWREPLLLLGEMLSGARDRDQAWNIVAGLLCHEDAQPADGRDYGCHWATWLAGRIVHGNSMQANAGIRDRPILSQMRRLLRKALVAGETLPARERVDCAKALGAVGDDRPGVGITTSGLPALEFWRVDGGTAHIGTTPGDAAAISTREWALGWGFRGSAKSR